MTKIDPHEESPFVHQADPDQEQAPAQAIEGLSGFSFIEPGEEATPAEAMPQEEIEFPQFNPENPVSAIASSAPTLGHIPLALCDEQLMTELGSIPDRLAFKIGDVAELIDVKTYVLRYWETEFEILNPKKSKNNQRVYSRRDVETVLLIKKLLYRDRFSIEGARSALKQLRGEVKKQRTLLSTQNRVEQAIDKVSQIQADIRRLRQLFENV